MSLSVSLSHLLSTHFSSPLLSLYFSVCVCVCNSLSLFLSLSLSFSLSLSLSLSLCRCVCVCVCVFLSPPGENGLQAGPAGSSLAPRERVRGKGMKDCPYCGKAFRSSHHLKVHLHPSHTHTHLHPSHTNI